MPEDEFWQFIDILGGSADDDAVTRLTEALRGGGKRTAVGFAERLAATLYDLDREELFRQPVRWADAPDEDAIPLSDDSFLYLRAGIVARGKDSVEAVLADPAVLQAELWDDGESLLYAAEEAAGDQIETRLSYETGSNAAFWSPPDDDGDTHVRPLVAVFLEDLLDSIQGFVPGTNLTVPLPPLYVWPRWFPEEVETAVQELCDSAVREAGGIPTEMDVEQLQITVGFGERWRLTPRIEPSIQDDTGLGRVLRTHAEMHQADVRAWSSEEQQAALLAVVARSLLDALPEKHGSRIILERAMTAGESLLPTPE